jgi:hypothetical protein
MCSELGVLVRRTGAADQPPGIKFALYFFSLHYTLASVLIPSIRVPSIVWMDFKCPTKLEN